MKEKTKLRIMQILCIISLIITVFSIQRTYAKYFERVDTTYTTNIKRWVINVNNIDIHGKSKELATIMQPTFVENEHMNENKLVPGREGYFEFLLDYSKVDIAFKFEFDIKQPNQQKILEDFEIYGYSIVTKDPNTNKETETITTLAKVNDFAGLTQVIDPEIETEKNKTIRILFRWNDTNKDTIEADKEIGMNNNEDTQYVRNNTEFNYIVKITFTQQV